jgi:hypothetical protein
MGLDDYLENFGRNLEGIPSKDYNMSRRGVLFGGLIAAVIAITGCPGGGNPPGPGPTGGITNPRPSLGKKVDDQESGMQDGDFVNLYRSYSINGNDINGQAEMDAIISELSGLTVTGYATTTDSLKLRLQGAGVDTTGATDSDNDNKPDLVLTIKTGDNTAVKNFSAFHKFATGTASYNDVNKQFDDYLAANIGSIADNGKGKKVYGILNGIRPNYYIRHNNGTTHIIYVDSAATPLDTSLLSDFDLQLKPYFQANPTGTWVDPANGQLSNYHVHVFTDGTTPGVRNGLGQDANGKDKVKDLKLIDIAKALY